jgi:hypothetical protein
MVNLLTKIIFRRAVGLVSARQPTFNRTGTSSLRDKLLGRHVSQASQPQAVPEK